MSADTLPSGDELSPDLVEMMKAAALQRKKVEWAAWVDQQYTQCRNARAQMERQWYINMAFYSGRHYIAPVDLPAIGFRLVTPHAPPWRVRAVVNKVRTAAIHESAKLCSSRPIPIVVPATTESEDYGAATVAEQILKTDFASDSFTAIFKSWVDWGGILGNAFIKQWWDPLAPDFNNMMEPPWPSINGQPISPDIVNRIPELKEQSEKLIPARGKICRSVVNPFHVYVPDLLTENLQDQPYIIHASTRSPLWVERTYGIKAVADARASNTLLDTATVITKGATETFDSVLVKEIWIKQDAHPDFPQGGMLVVINSQVVYCAEEWPLPFMEYPFYKYNALFTGGFYNDSRLVDLIPLNKEYNKTRSQGIEIKNVMGKPRILYQQGSVNPRKIGSEVGQSIPYTAGYQPPTVMPAVEIPASYSSELDRINADFYEISGQLDFNNNNQDVTSGTGLAFLQEQDELKLGNQVSSIEVAIQQMGRHYLQLISTYYTDGRVIKLTGKDQAYEAYRWKKNALRGNTDVRVQTGSALPVNKAAKQALVTEYMQNGFLTPETGLEILNMGDLDRALNEFLVDKKQAMRENLKMQEMPEEILKKLMFPQPAEDGTEPYDEEVTDDFGGKRIQQFNGDGTPFQPQPPIPVNSYDNDEAHMQWHNFFRKSQEFETLSEAHKRAFELHCQGHQLKMMQNQVNMSGQMLVENEAPPQPGMPAEEGGGAFGEDDPQFGESPDNAAATVGRAGASQVRQGSGPYNQ